MHAEEKSRQKHECSGGAQSTRLAKHDDRQGAGEGTFREWSVFKGRKSNKRRREDRVGNGRAPTTRRDKRGREREQAALTGSPATAAGSSLYPPAVSLPFGPISVSKILEACLRRRLYCSIEVQSTAGPMRPCPSAVEARRSVVAGWAGMAGLH